MDYWEEIGFDPSKLKEIGIDLISKLRRLPVFKTLVVLGGAVFLAQMTLFMLPISQQARKWNVCLDAVSADASLSRDPSLQTEEAQMAAAVIRCNGGSLSNP